MTKRTSSLMTMMSRFLMLSILCGTIGSAIAIAQAKFPAGAYRSGSYTITFLADGSHTVSEGNDVLVKGSYTIAGDQIVMTDKEGALACGSTEHGKYKWTAVEGNLKLEKVEDSCDGRSGALSGKILTKQ